MKPRAFCYIRDLPHYRRDSFVSGLGAAGYEVYVHGSTSAAGPRAGDVVLIFRFAQNDNYS